MPEQIRYAIDRESGEVISKRGNGVACRRMTLDGKEPIHPGYKLFKCLEMYLGEWDQLEWVKEGPSLWKLFHWRVLNRHKVFWNRQ